MAQLHLRSYQGEAKSRLIFHTQASEEFLANNAFNIARNALVFANQALADLKRTDAQQAKPYAKRLAQIEEAIDRKDPSLIAKIGQTIDSWISSVAQ